MAESIFIKKNKQQAPQPLTCNRRGEAAAAKAARSLGRDGQRGLGAQSKPGNTPARTPSTGVGKSTKNLQRGEDDLFNSCCWRNWISTRKEWAWILISHQTQTPAENCSAAPMQDLSQSDT